MHSRRRGSKSSAPRSARPAAPRAAATPWAANAAARRLPTFAPVQRHQHLRPRCATMRRCERALRQQCPQAVDAGIADAMDPLGRRAFGQQIHVRGKARREMVVRMIRDAAAEPLFGKRIGNRRRTQSGFHVDDGTSCLRSRARARVSGQRITLDQHQRRAAVRDDAGQSFRQMAARRAQVGSGRECRRLRRNRTAQGRCSVF